MTESQISDIFDASLIFVVTPAADQDGYDGGWLAYDAEREAWGQTPEQAKLALENARGSI